MTPKTKCQNEKYNKIKIYIQKKQKQKNEIDGLKKYKNKN